ncbi:hypothetical protein H5410_002964, partial [Solanum commersonii]
SFLIFNQETRKTTSRIPTSFGGIEESMRANKSSGKGDTISHSTHILHPYSHTSDSLRWGLTGERTVKRLQLSKGITVPDSTSIYDASRRMATRRVDVLLLTDSNALLCGTLTQVSLTSTINIAQVLFHVTDMPIIPKLKRKIEELELKKKQQETKAIETSRKVIPSMEKCKKQLMIVNSDFMAKVEENSCETYLSAVECLGVVGFEFPLFPCFVWCDCYPDLHVCIRLSLDISHVALFFGL